MRRYACGAVGGEFAIEIGHHFFLLDRMRGAIHRLFLKTSVPRECRAGAPEDLSTPCARETAATSRYSQGSGALQRFLRSSTARTRAEAEPRARHRRAARRRAAPRAPLRDRLPPAGMQPHTDVLVRFVSAH